ncbi:MAG: altronate dehydratase [Proteobacteria bacterium]|nr:altronate dehydratase [Pseudomonadota bacterium]NIS68753.1 altronate dehydratase [Pseudomonadota bacterium]
MELFGYQRRDGRVGVRNHLLILSSVVCANEAALRIKRRVPQAAIVTHPFGCGMLGEDFDQVKRTLLGFATHPNVGAVIVVGLGCEEIDSTELAGEMRRHGQRAESLAVQNCGGTQRTVKQGVELGRQMNKILADQTRTKSSISELIMATECGGSDFSSGLAANPAIGYASDRLIELGGTVILSETAEIIGAEHILASRAINERVAKKIHAAVDGVEESARRAGVDIRGAQPSPGNIRGGISSIEEKSLGCIYKAGTKPVQGVLEYAEPIQGKGLWIMDTPGQDVESLTGMVAGGAQIAAFSTGLGTPVGCPIAPVIKITGNDKTAQSMRSHIDINTGAILKGRDTIKGVGEKILRLLLAVANGKPTKAERLGHCEFAITRIEKTI